MINELEKIPAEERINNRIEKFGKMGFWEEKTV
jgi:acetyl-CoA carboxylase carboxyl transferase subunit alpha